MKRALLESHPNVLRREPPAAWVDKKCSTAVRCDPAAAGLQPDVQRLKGFAAYRHTATFFALAEYIRLGGLQVYPATGLPAGPNIQPNQLADAQATAIKQLGNAAVARLGRVSYAPSTRSALVAGQLHGFVHAERFGQRSGNLGRANVLHRVAGHQALTPKPGVKPAPAGQDQCNAPGTSATTVHLRDPAPDMGVLHLEQRHLSSAGRVLELMQIKRIQFHCALCQSLFNADMLEVTLDQRVSTNSSHWVHGLTGLGRLQAQTGDGGTRQITNLGQKIGAHIGMKAIRIGGSQNQEAKCVLRRISAQRNQRN